MERGVRGTDCDEGSHVKTCEGEQCVCVCACVCVHVGGGERRVRAPFTRTKNECEPRRVIYCNE